MTEALLIFALVAFGAFCFFKSKTTPKTGASGGSKPSDGNKPDKA